MSFYKPPVGFVWNPLLKIGRNDPCPCNSRKKFKKCHLPDMPRVLDRSLMPDKPIRVMDKK